MSTGLFLAEEAFHQWLAIVVIPFSVFALYLGCKHHKRTQLLCLGLTGVGVLLVCAAFGHDLFGETGEKIVTVFGACIIAVAHVRNYLLCRDHRDCDCISSQT